MINNEMVIKFIEEIREDYEKYHEGKSPEDWLLDAIKRDILDITEEDAIKIRDELVEGIDSYMEAKAKAKHEDVSLKSIPQEINEEIELLADNTINYFEETLNKLE